MKLSVKEKLGYSLGDTASHFVWDLVNFWLIFYYTDILGIRVPSIVIPVHPGRNLAIIIEIAAMNNRQKKLGYNTAEEFNKRLMEQMGIGQ